MLHWNVVVNLHEHGFRRAFKLLQGLGAVYTTDFLNVLVMRVSNISRFLETLNAWMSDPTFISPTNEVHLKSLLKRDGIKKKNEYEFNGVRIKGISVSVIISAPSFS